MNVTELKAEAYDRVAAFERLRAELAQVPGLFDKLAELDRLRAELAEIGRQIDSQLADEQNGTARPESVLSSKT